MKLPVHIELSLNHNAHMCNYETAEYAINKNKDEPNVDYYDDESWVSLEEKQKSIETNEIWTCHWYPYTPVGFNTLHASSLDVLLEALEKWAKEEKEK